MTMETKTTSKMKNRLMNMVVIPFFLGVALTIAGISLNYFKSGNGEDTAAFAHYAMSEQVAVPNQTTDTGAKIYVTSSEVNVRKDASAEAQVMGTLDKGVSVTAQVSENSDWAYVPEVRGYVHNDFLKRVGVEEITGTVIPKNTNTNPYYVSKPQDGSDVTKTEISPYCTYTTEPVLYNNKFYKIGENAYIDKELVNVQYWDKDYYKSIKSQIESEGILGIEKAKVAGFRKADISLSITSPSGCTVDELNHMVKGTGLAGLGSAFKAIEENNQVNAIFAISVAQLESGNGTSYLARAQNNIFGLDPYNGGMSFGTKADCVAYFGRLIRKHYFNGGRTNIYDINAMYEPASNAWAGKVQDLMYRNRAKIAR